jgi:protoporphyrinogen IX oxidase
MLYLSLTSYTRTRSGRGLRTSLRLCKFCSYGFYDHRLHNIAVLSLIMLWIKAFHVIFVICWFAGIFYLPRLFVYHAMATDSISNERFKVMERKLYRGIMTPTAVLAILTGAALLAMSWSTFAEARWLHAKLGLVAALIGYHVYCGIIVRTFATDSNQRSDRYYRWFNELPLLALIPIVILAVVKPF